MSYLLDNLLQVAAASVLLSVICLPPGWLILRWLTISLPNWLGFPIAILIGLLIVPFILNLIGMIITLDLGGRVLIWLVMNGVFLEVSRISNRGMNPASAINESPNLVLYAIAFIALTITLFPLLFHNVPVDGNWYHVMAGDWIKHIGVGNALATDDHLPPANPFLITEPKLRYYYFAYILPGMISRVSGGAITVTNSLIASAVLIACCFPFLLYGYARRIGLTISAALFAVFMINLISGLDIAYVLDEHQQTGSWVEHIDFWANHDLRRINSISNMFIWTPQHVLGIVGFVLVLWLVQDLWGDSFIKEKTNPSSYPLLMHGEGIQGWGQIVSITTILTLLLASLSGTSAFAWFGIICALGAFTAFEGFRWLRNRTHIIPLVAIITAVLLSLILSYPYLHVVGERGESAFIIDISPTVSGIKYGGIFSELFGASTLTYILDYPFQMAIEFGAVILTGLYGLWLVRRTNRVEVRFWVISLLVFFAIVLAVRPDRTDSNNYAARVAPLAWIILGILSGCWWQQRQHWHWIVLAVPLLLGIGSTLYEPWIQQGSNYQRLFGGEPAIQRNNYVTADQHALYKWLNEHTARDDVYQVGWESGKAAYFVERHTAIAEGYLALLYVSYDTLFYIDAIAPLEFAFNSTDAAAAASALQQLDLDYLVTEENTTLPSQSDPAFATAFSLVYTNDSYQVYKIH